jgi:hypothetical protein
MTPKRGLSVLLSSVLILGPLGQALAQSDAPAPAAPVPPAGSDAPAPPAGSAAPPSPPAAPSAEEEDVSDEDLADAEDAPTPAPQPPAAEEKPEAEAEDTDAELEAELLGGEDPGRPPPKGKGVIWGVIKETEFGETLVEAPVQVLGTKNQAVTDLEGRFRLELPPGTYKIRISYELHKSQRVDDIHVAAGQVVRLDAQLVPDKGAVDVFEVIEEADKTSLEGMILARQRATVVGDSVGRLEISKSTDRNAAQAAQRVVGTTIVGGRFVFVRGLGERYTNALINGVPLPSPEPDRAAVPLDLFPSAVLNSLTIAKTFTPDMPADFAGGSVRIETREIPNKPLFAISARGGYNTNSTFRERLTYRGGGLDWLGIDDGTRALPDGFPKYNLAAGSVTDEQQVAAGRQLNSYMSAQRGGTPPDHGLSVVAGNGWDLGNDRKFGVLAALNYGRSYTVRRGEIFRIFKGDRTDPRGFVPSRDYVGSFGNDSVNWGGYGSVAYRFSAQHRLSLIGIRSTLSDNRTQYLSGYHDVREQTIHATLLRFTTRALNLGILSGEHHFPSLDGAQLDWNAVLSSATRDEPDRRDTVWGRGTAGPNYFYTDAPESGRHFFSEQSETQKGAGIDWTQPLGPRETKLKLGIATSFRDRDFTSRSMRLRPAETTECAPPYDFDACNDALFVPGNIGPRRTGPGTGTTSLELDENTRSTDAYNAFLNVYSAYVMADLGITDEIRAVVGERIEHTNQVIDPYDQFTGGNVPGRAQIRQTDLLPVATGIWSPTKQTKVRASATRTLARPQLRELAPFTFQNYFGGQVEGGNPDLKMTKITNLDARIEHYPTLRDVFAFSVFYKDFRDPIEPVVKSGGDEGSISYANALGAQLVGFEFEARRNLESIATALKDITVVSNLTLAYSSIQIADEDALSLTNRSRALVHQAPWVFNFALDYALERTKTNARLAYNVVGPRIARVGSDGLDDIYEHPRHQVDVTLQQTVVEHVSVKLEAKNLLNSSVMLTQGCGNDGLFDGRWHWSCSRGKGSAVSYFTEGVSFGLTGTYDF